MDKDYKRVLRSCNLQQTISLLQMKLLNKIIFKREGASEPCHGKQQYVLFCGGNEVRGITESLERRSLILLMFHSLLGSMYPGGFGYRAFCNY